MKFFSFILFFIFSFVPFCFGDSEYHVIVSDDKNEEELLQQIRFSLIQEALFHQGKPYVWAANGPRSFDCSGFISYVYKQLNVKLPRFSLDQGKAGIQIKLHSLALRTGDIIYFYFPDKKWPHHVGLYIDAGNFIHAASGEGVTISSLESPKWRYAVKHISRVFFTREQIYALMEQIPVAQNKR